MATAERELVMPRDETGSFVAAAPGNGPSVRVLVDTGAPLPQTPPHALGWSQQR